MANLFDPRKSSNVTQVSLPPINDSYFQDFTLEPQMVRSRTLNTANLYVYSSDVVVLNPDTLSTRSSDYPNKLHVKQYNTRGGSILMRKIKRMGISHVNFSHTTPNVNIRNNTITVYRADTNAIVNVIIQEGFYNSPKILITAIVARLNIDMPGMGFVYENVLVSPQNVFVLRAVVPFYILPESSMVLRGRSLAKIATGFYFGRDPVVLATLAKLTWLVGPMHMQYTAYVDFSSTVLNSYTKIPSASTLHGPNRLLTRLYLDRWDGYESNPDDINYYAPDIKRDYRVENDNPVFFTWNPEENVSTFDIQVTDEFGDYFYLPTQYTSLDTSIIEPFENFTGGLDWHLTFNCEI